jgi:hypothetical protein
MAGLQRRWPAMHSRRQHGDDDNDDRLEGKTVILAVALVALLAVAAIVAAVPRRDVTRADRLIQASPAPTPRHAAPENQEPAQRWAQPQARRDAQESIMPTAVPQSWLENEPVRVREPERAGAGVG